MATGTVLLPHLTLQEIPDEVRTFLDLKETPDAFDVKTLSGARLLRPKRKVYFPWQLLQGVWDDGIDTADERRANRRSELEQGERKFGSPTV